MIILKEVGTYFLVATFFSFTSDPASGSLGFVSFCSALIFFFGITSFFFSWTIRVDFFNSEAGGGARLPVRCVQMG